MWRQSLIYEIVTEVLQERNVSIYREKSTLNMEAVNIARRHDGTSRKTEIFYKLYSH